MDVHEFPLAVGTGAPGPEDCAQRSQIVDEASRWGFVGSVQKGTLGRRYTEPFQPWRAEGNCGCIGAREVCALGMD